MKKSFCLHRRGIKENTTQKKDFETDKIWMDIEMIMWCANTPRYPGFSTLLYDDDDDDDREMDRVYEIAAASDDEDCCGFCSCF